MKIFRIKIVALGLGVILVALLMNMCGGSSATDGDDDTDGDGDSSVTVSFAPSATASAISRSATVSATFSAAITEPLSWYNLVKLQKNGTGATLCSSVSYEASSRTISCGHDTLDENTSYTITVAGIKDASSNCITDSTNTFTTAQELPVNSVTKTSVSSEEDGGTTQIELLINMEIEALPAVEVAMSESGAAEPAATADADCVASGDDTLCTVTVSGVAGCATPTDYEVTLSAEGYEDYVIHFNSADNEFEEATTVSDNDCWIQDHSAGDADNEFDWSASGGNLVMTMDNLGTGSHDIYYDQPFADSKEGAFVVYISDLETPATNGTNFDLVMVQATNSQFDGLNGIVSGYNGLADPAYSGWGSVYEGGNGYQWGIPLETGDLNDIADVYDGYYICMTAYDDLLTTYISTDGDNYYKLTEDNMRCDTGTSCNIDQIDSRSIADWDDLRLSIQVGSDNGAGDGTLTAKFGFARFRTSNLNGSMADCPRMNR